MRKKKKLDICCKSHFLWFLSRKEKVSVKLLLLASFFKEAKEKKRHGLHVLLAKKRFRQLLSNFVKVLAENKVTVLILTEFASKGFYFVSEQQDRTLSPSESVGFFFFGLDSFGSGFFFF